MLQLKTDHANLGLEDELQKLEAYTERLRGIYESGTYTQAECSINLSKDDALLGQVQDLVKQKITPSLKYSIVVGIGGSNLGTKAVYDALIGHGDLFDSRYNPRMLFAETTDPEMLVQMVAMLRDLTSKDEVLVTLISKSGGTTETLANFEVIMEPLRTKFGDACLDRVVVITDEGSKLWNAAHVEEVSCLAIPAKVGGRYSVLSAVGLFPLASAGIDIVAIRQGATQMLDDCFATDNLAARSAAVLATQSKNGRTINDNFFFHPELESIGKWYRQLMGESIGKERSLDGQVVHAGITPTVSLGSTDLHSVGQLYLGGPRDKVTTFVSSATSVGVEVPSERVFPDLVPMIDGKSAADIMTAILDGVKIAYQKAELPFMEVSLDAIDEQSLGAFLQFKMLEMMYLAQSMNVNCFDQPNVEDYKIETKRILEGTK
jgi:glucose-6-phosphate isomerase